MIDRATKHAEQVVLKNEPAGLYHYLACKRHIDELEKQGTKEFPYMWVPEKSERILNFAETLTLVEGFNPKPLVLHDFQHFDLGVPFGWVNREGFRRFRRKYKSVARQNGKTMENGITLGYVAGFSGYKNGKLFTAATKKAQARLAWEELAKFIQADPELSEYFEIKDYKSLITAKNTNCTIEAVSKERGLDDGFRSIFCSIDELHQHKDNQVYKALYDGQGDLDEALISMITTRGRDLNSFCHEMDDYCINILNGTAIADDFFVDIFTLDKEDDIFNKDVWYKANPHIVTNKISFETLERDAETARVMGGHELANFKQKKLNMWVQDADNQYINPDDWKACGTNLTLEDMRGKRCYLGIDLSSGGDLTSIALLFPLDDGKIYVYSHSFMPAQRLNEHIKSDLAPYDVWQKQGLLTTTHTFGGYKNDYKFIISHLKELISKYDIEIVGIGYDPHNADAFLGDLEEFGVPTVAITQSARALNDATDDFRLEVKAKNILYNHKNDLMTWSIVNAKVVENSFKEIKVDKSSRNSRIDVVDAIIDAHKMIISKKEDEVDISAFATEEFLTKLWG